MKKNPSLSARTGKLLVQPEKKGSERADKFQETLENLSPEEIRQTLNDLRGHQINLEMQNEELRKTQEELDAVRSRYFDLYNLAPVGYVTVSEKGMILEANLTAATLLGVTRNMLIKQTLPRFILSEDQDIYYRYRKQLFETGEQKTCELRMVKKNGMIFWGHLAAITAHDSDGNPVCKIAIGDITERKKAKEELKEELIRRHILFDQSPDGILIIDPQTAKFVEFNTAAHQQLGYSREEFAQLGIHDVEVKETEKKTKERIKRVISSGRADFETLQHTRQGEVRNVHVTAQIINIKGNPVYHCVWRDITERKRMEEGLLESEIRFRELFQRMNNGVAVYRARDNGEDFVFQDINPAGERLSKVNKEEILGRSILEVFPGIRDIGLFDVFQRVWRSGIPERHPVSLYKDKRILQWVENNIYKLKSGEIVAIFDDVTRRKIVEEELIIQYAFMKTLIDTIPNPVFYKDTEGRYLGCNSAFESYIGHSKDEIVGKTVYEVAPCDLAEIYHKADLSLISKPGIQKYESSVKYADGSRHDVVFNKATFLDSKEKIGGLVGIIEDITELKQAEEELTVSQQKLRALADRLSKIREEERLLISREIHDTMGGGLTGLKMDLSRIIHEVQKAEPDKEQTGLMSNILLSNESIDQMIKVVRRICTDLRPPILDDLGLIAALEWHLSELTKHTGVSHEITTSFDYIRIENDVSIAVFRIFQEALTNIIRHSGATKVVVSLQEDERNLFGDENLIIKVVDNGSGITEEDILKPESLGLLGMKERAMAFGGELSLSGEPGRGTTVVLKIPLKRWKP